MNKQEFDPLNLVFVQKCAECAEPCKDVLCEKCFKKLKRLSSFTCEKCGKPLGSCICKTLKCNFERSVAVFDFDRPPVSSIVYKHKSSGTKITADFLCKCLAEKISREYRDIEFDCVTYVPTTRRQLAKKGFDHAQILAEGVSEILGCKFVKSPVCKRYSVKQKYLDTENRKKIAPKLFKLRCRAKISGTVLLVDDVMTTGNTLSSCAALLKIAGAEKIYCACAATATKN